MVWRRSPMMVNVESGFCARSDCIKALNMASYLEVDAVIDPADSRAWLLRGLNAAPRPPRRDGKKRPFIDTW